MSESQTSRCRHWRDNRVPTSYTGLTTIGSCPYCEIERQQAEICTLMERVTGLRSEVISLRSPLIQAQRMEVPSGWQPIDTAPKDGTKIILARSGWWNDSGSEVGSDQWKKDIWDNAKRVYGFWWAVLGFWSAKWGNWNDGFEPAGLADPNYWMPLPDPPAPAPNSPGAHTAPECGQKLRDSVG